MGPTDWNEVGDRFTELGAALRQRWATSRAETCEAEQAAEDEMREAVEGVRVSLDGFADAIIRTVNDEEVHGAARSVAVSLFDALSSSLDGLADKLDPENPSSDGPGKPG